MATQNCCCSGSTESSLLFQILQQDAAITVRWAQVLQAAGLPASPQTVISASSCSETEVNLLQNILDQRQAIYNSMFFG